ncbi:MAG: type II toxin-antitoxin system VapC family toxin [Sulfobacillus sp.]
MKGFVRDNSVVMDWCLKDEASGYARSALDALSYSEAGAPALWPVEMVNAWRAAARRAHIAPPPSARLFNLVGNLPTQIGSDLCSWTAARVLDRGRTFALSSYGATHLELAERLGVPLATEGGQLIRAGNVLGVEI